ncbi:MAG: methyltransferase domain-containing protein [Bdellovibrionales bacterium]|nr:methyltransferase domain-containing protein [Bdellovibrionales bacterium]
MNRFIQIDEEGYFLSGGIRVTDEYYGRNLFENLRVENRAFITKSENLDIFVEAFDEPLVALRVEAGVGSQNVTDSNHNTTAKQTHNISDSTWTLTLPYGYQTQFSLNTLVSDEWDRFHGRTVNGLPFVLSRAAQMQLFDLVEAFDDDSITVSGREYKIVSLNERDKSLGRDGSPLTPGTRPDINTPEFWSESYHSWHESGNKPGWELGCVAKPITEVIPQIKIPRSKVCIFGCGTGHDAAYFASQGHIVTAVDISAAAIEKARTMNPERENLKYVCADAFDFARKNPASFDMVFEHTFFCAIAPDRRSELISAWNSVLTEYGHFIGIFFTFDRAGGPPFGSSEWELRQRLKKNFEFLYWTRWKTSIDPRLGKELVVYARKKLR